MSERQKIIREINGITKENDSYSDFSLEQLYVVLGRLQTRQQTQAPQRQEIPNSLDNKHLTLGNSVFGEKPGMIGGKIIKPTDSTYTAMPEPLPELTIGNTLFNVPMNNYYNAKNPWKIDQNKK